MKLTERGAHRRLRVRIGARPPLGRGTPGGPRRRSEALAVAAALVVAIAVVAAVLGVEQGGNATHATTHKPSPRHPVRKIGQRPSTNGPTAQTTSSPAAPAILGPRGGPVPTGFSPQSFTAIGELTWWLLGNAPCSTPPCTSIVRTKDGGRTFVGIPAPRSPLGASTSQPGVSKLRFADQLNGFAFGGSLYVTHDGGSGWRPVELGGSVSELAISAGEVYAIVVPRAGAPGKLMRSPVGADRWSALPAPAGVSYGLWAHGGDVVVQSAATKNLLLVSHDSGSTFAGYPSPSSGLPCDFEEPAPATVWAHCPTGTMSGVWRSVDGGRSFHQANFCRCEPRTGLPLPNSAAFGAASAGTAVVGYQQLYRTTDAGASYSAVGPPGLLWQYLGFTDPTHGVALGLPSSSSAAAERLYYTTDGGASYHRVSIR